MASLLKRAKNLILPGLYTAKGRRLSTFHAANGSAVSAAPEPGENPLTTYFENHNSGPGIWKWNHYLDVYHRHLNRFRDRPVNVLEIGIFSGGSLGIWLDYFGPEATIYGVDIEPACKAYETERIHVEIGNQGDRGFWRDFLARTPGIDVVIDDGSHLHPDQIVTLEEVLPRMNRGGVFICEDVHARFNRFASYAYGIADQLNDMNADIYKDIDGVSFYPSMVVIEKRLHPLPELKVEKRGSEWQPPEFGIDQPRPR